LAELVFYGAVIFWFRRDANLIRLSACAGICLAFRLFLGFLFGALISIMYIMNFKISISLGMVSYIPAILCHVIVTPFILKPILRETDSGEKKRPRLVINSAPTNRSKSTTPDFSNKSSFEEQQEAENMTPWVGSTNKQHSGITSQIDATPGNNTNGFDRATQYLGEIGTVMMALVVDNEGLLLSHFVRDNMSLDDWTPLALLFKQNNNQVLDRVGMKNVDKVTLNIGSTRVTVTSEEGINLMVLSEIQQDDVLNIRVTQSMEIIRKYMTERYGHELFVNAEKKYV
jgi:hypothetical protein